MATLPNVCKTPSPGGPVPIPYPNIAQSSTLKNGTKTVTSDGKKSAIKGSEFSSSNGDEPGTAGGVKSSTNMKEAKWLTYSFDVKLEGKNACRLTDKMTMNHGNTVCMGGLLQPAQLAAMLKTLEKVACECQKEEQPNRKLPQEKQCDDLIDRRGKCTTRKLKDKESAGIWANARFEAPPGMTNPKTGKPVTRIQPDVVLTVPGTFPESTISVGKRKRASKSKMTPGGIDTVVEFKFPCPPSTRKPYPDHASDGKGYGQPQRPGDKELNAYRDLCTPPQDVEMIVPSEALCD
ncbi:DUF4150 domain-containing protein [Archangium violaceum]|uniref:DUF4150 domain-containing protein n=1 Tax=Archangium violaceum TaxID=83451 RepID=UPI0036D8A6CA